MKKILICGHFANGKPSFDGQTIKTVNLYNELIKMYGRDNVLKIDTYFFKKNPIKFFFEIIKKTKNINDLIMLPAQRGIKLFPLIFNFINKQKKFKIHYVVIGGWLPSLIKNNKRIRNELLKFNFIYVETTKTIQQLENMGFKNICQMNNFKNLKITDRVYHNNGDLLKCCIFSRVEKLKGIDDAIEVINNVNQRVKKRKVYLDIYGKIKDEYREHFNELINNNKYINYKGTVDSNESVEVLEKYHLLLFPTLYFTEGIPGTIIDAFFSGLPILSSRWENIDDMIKENYNGLIYEFSDKNDFEEKLTNVLTGKYDLEKMSEGCIKSANSYLPKNSLNILFENINN